MSVNFKVFEQFSRDEAETYKLEFLRFGERAMPGLSAEARAHGIDADLSIESVIPVLEWLSTRTSTTPTSPDPSLPEWIRTWPDYARNAFDFDEPSRLVILRAAYYLGEGFVRAYGSLGWAIGAPDTAPEGQPVVTGFEHQMEMAVLLVATNLFARLVADPSKAPDIKRAVETWRAKVAPDETSRSG